MSALAEMAHALRALDPPAKKRQRDPEGTTTLTMDDVELVAQYQYERTEDGFNVFDVTLKVKATEGLLDAVRDLVAFQLRQDAEEAAAERQYDRDDRGDWDFHRDRDDPKSAAARRFE